MKQNKKKYCKQHDCFDNCSDMVAKAKDDGIIHLTDTMSMARSGENRGCGMLVPLEIGRREFDGTPMMGMAPGASKISEDEKMGMSGATKPVQGTAIREQIPGGPRKKISKAKKPTMSDSTRKGRRDLAAVTAPLAFPLSTIGVGAAQNKGHRAAGAAQTTGGALLGGIGGSTVGSLVGGRIGGAAGGLGGVAAGAGYAQSKLDQRTHNIKKSHGAFLTDDVSKASAFGTPGDKRNTKYAAATYGGALAGNQVGRRLGARSVGQKYGDVQAGAREAMQGKILGHQASIGEMAGSDPIGAGKKLLGAIKEGKEAAKVAPGMVAVTHGGAIGGLVGAAAGAGAYAAHRHHKGMGQLSKAHDAFLED